MDDHTRDPSVEPPPAGQHPSGWNDRAGRWEHATLRRAVVHGVRLFNAEAYHASHDCFEAEWYNYARGSVESAFLHGMVQVAAGEHKRADVGELAGMTSLFETALAYLHGVPGDFYGVDVRRVRTRVTNALAAPEQAAAWRISLDGQSPAARDRDHDYVDGLP